MGSQSLPQPRIVTDMFEDAPMQFNRDRQGGMQQRYAMMALLPVFG
jgi:hypothetical protein